MKWVLSRSEELSLTKLEQLFLQLNEVMQHTRSNTTSCGPLSFKSNLSYMTNDGYMTGSLVWYMHCEVDGRLINVFGRTPEQCIENALLLFTNLKDMDDAAFDSWVCEFRRKLRDTASAYARYTHLT